MKESCINDITLHDQHGQRDFFDNRVRLKLDSRRRQIALRFPFAFNLKLIRIVAPSERVSNADIVRHSD